MQAQREPLDPWGFSDQPGTSKISSGYSNEGNLVQKKNPIQVTYNLSMHKYCQLFQALLQNNHLSAAVFEELVEVNLRDGVESFVEV